MASRSSWLRPCHSPLSSSVSRRTGDQGVLDDLRHPRRELPAAERLQGGDVGDDRAWLLEQPDQVLALGDVETDLAADARVDHRDQIGRAVHEVEPTEIRRRDEAGDIADGGVTERHDRRRPVDVGVEHAS